MAQRTIQGSPVYIQQSGHAGNRFPFRPDHLCGMIYLFSAQLVWSPYVGSKPKPAVYLSNCN